MGPTKLRRNKTRNSERNVESKQLHEIDGDETNFRKGRTYLILGSVLLIAKMRVHCTWQPNLIEKS
jgi:hypothetical protein